MTILLPEANCEHAEWLNGFVILEVRQFFFYQAGSAIGEFFLRELSAVTGAVTITCLMLPFL